MTMLDDKDYMFRDDYKEDTVPIEIMKGPYKGVVLRFTRVSIREQEDNTAKCLFEYHLYETGDHTEVSLRQDKKFIEYIGLILNELVLESVGEVE